MILQGVKQMIQPLEVGYANSPKKAQKGGMWFGVFPCIRLPGLDLRGDFQVSLNSLRNCNFGAFGGPMARAT